MSHLARKGPEKVKISLIALLTDFIKFAATRQLFDDIEEKIYFINFYFVIKTLSLPYATRVGPQKFLT